ncbi:peptidoglycan/LPS O-acetylase OafA/YrhL [Salinibacterium sp. CAN_S4]|uniref:acyltransferase family protein n=1 Tax=Salinibacterium sp. CAN_S4 TaxID=2787727 RepID=UPI0018EF5634
MTDGTSEQVTVRPGSKQLDSIQVARGFAALSVVAFHALDIESRYFSGPSILPGFFDGGQAGVDLFFVISGFVMVLTTRRKHGTVRAVGGFAWNRLFRIYPTYWAYFLILLPVFFLFPTMINASQGNQVNLFTSFFLLPSDTLPLLLVAWTLTLELWFYVVFTVILLLPERFLVAALGLWFVVLVAVNWNGPIDSHPFVEVPSNAMAIEFILGGITALLFRRITRSLAMVVSLAGLAVIVFLGVTPPQSITAGAGVQRPLVMGVGFALILAGFTAFENRGTIGVVKRLAILGDMSYSVYLGHILVLSAMGRIWQSISGPLDGNVLAMAGWWILTIAAVLIFGYLSYRVVEKPVAGLSKRWRSRVFREDRQPALVIG